MQVRTGNPASRTNLSDCLPLFNLLAEADIDLAEVGEQRDQALSMVDINQFAAEKEITRFDDPACTGCKHGCTLVSGDIHAAMRSSFLSIENPATAETAGTDTLNGAQKININVNHRVLITCFLFARLLRQDTFHIAGVGINLALVGYRDMLRAVLFLLYLEKLLEDLVGAALFDKVFSRLQTQGQTYQGCGFAFNFCNQHGLIQKAVSGVIPGFEIDDRNTTRNQ